MWCLSINFYFIVIASDFFFISLNTFKIEKDWKKSHVVLKHTDLAKSGSLAKWHSLANQMYQKGIREGEVCSLSSSLPSPWLISITQWVSHTHVGTVTISQVFTPYTRKLHLTLCSPYSFMKLVFVPLEFGSIHSSCLNLPQKIQSGSIVMLAVVHLKADTLQIQFTYFCYLQRMGSDLCSWLVLSEQPPTSQNRAASQWLSKSVCSAPQHWNTNSLSILASSQFFSKTLECC